MEINYKYNNSFIAIVGDNGSGKTTLCQKLFVSTIPIEKRYVLNSSRQANWNQYVLPDHIYKPYEYSKEWFENFLLNFASKHHDCVLVLDDYDNFNAKDSQVLKSVIINARHQNLGIIITTRNIQSIPIILYQQCTYAFIANQRVQYNRIYAGYWLGPENSARLVNLEKYTFLVFDNSNGSIDFVRMGGA